MVTMTAAASNAAPPSQTANWAMRSRRAWIRSNINGDSARSERKAAPPGGRGLPGPDAFPGLVGR